MRTLITYTGEEVLLDDEDHERLSAHRWSYDGRRVSRRPGDRGRQQYIFLHREILNAPEGFDVHHIDHNPLNNQKANLKVHSKSDHTIHHQLVRSRRNGYNKHAIPYKGVTLYHGRYRASIKAGDRLLWLGDHDTAEDAALVYDAAVLCYRDGQGFLNFL